MLPMKEFIRRKFPVLIRFYHFTWAFLSALFFRFPSRNIKVIGVTGTNGKSTVVELITRILEQAGYKTASLSSIRFKVKKEEWKNKMKMTMPGRGRIQSFLKKALDEKCDYAVVEVTSEGIKQYRHKFIDFDAAVLTNLSKEHIESHGGFENYKKAKGKLFKECDKIHVINLDDDNKDYFLKFKARKKINYGIDSEELSNGDIKAANVRRSSKGFDFTVRNTDFHLNLLSRFNIYNALAAIAVSLSQNISLEKCREGIEKVEGIPGRVETVVRKPFRVIVDYAHTPDSLQKVYETFSRKNQEESKMICVLGSCGGGRDKWKRPELGEIAGKYCDESILTNEDPYDENPERILSDIKSGISEKIAHTFEVLDRREAIKKALESAETNDTVIITGKGSEPWMCVANGKKIAWDDRKIVKEELKNLS